MDEKPYIFILEIHDLAGNVVELGSFSFKAKSEEMQKMLKILDRADWKGQRATIHDGEGRRKW